MSKTKMPNEWDVTEFECPSCHKPLVSSPDLTGRQLWCPYGDCVNIGANEGAHGKNDKEAFEILKIKLSR